MQRFLAAAILVFGLSAAGPTHTAGAQEGLGLALAGGGALGFAHLGVITVLEEIGFDPQYVSGTSIGSIVGSLYAAGYTVEEILDIVEAVDWNALFFDTPTRKNLDYDAKESTRRYRLSLRFADGALLGRSGLSAGQNVVEFLDELLEDYADLEDFRDLPRSLAIVATDLISSEEVVFTSGDLKSAVRASMAVPGIFSPLYYDGRYLIDGGWINNLPVDAVIDLGARTTIAVSLITTDRDIEELRDILTITDQANMILRHRTLSRNLEMADVVIAPDLREYTTSDFGSALELVEVGRQAALEKWDELVALKERIEATAAEAAPESRPAFDRRPPATRDEHLRIRDVRVEFPFENPLTEELDALRRVLRGGQFTRAELRETIYALYDGGAYEYVSYDLVRREDGSYDVVLYAVIQRSFDSEVRLGLGLRSSLDGEVNDRSMLNLNYRSRMNTERGRLEADVWLTEVPQARITVSGTVIASLRATIGAYTLSPPLIFYDGRTVESLYLQSRTGAELGFDFTALRRALVVVSGFVEQFALDRVQGVDQIEEINALRVGVGGQLRFDDLDRPIFPNRGGETTIGYRWRYDDEEESANDRFGISTRHFFPLGRVLNLQVRGALGTDFDARLPEYEQFSTGGAEIFEGYYYNELRGNHIVGLGADLRIAIFDLPLGIGEEAYVRLGGNIGRIWTEDIDEIVEFEAIAGARAALAFNTILGELNIGVSMNEDFRVLAYVLLGPAFTVDGDGYQW
ncbi:MAG: patatin-like phospholipase family protein [Spirochaetales bacterium]|nr:patatin-like phospholipase family protein [Spirochaetales bacterium]